MTAKKGAVNTLKAPNLPVGTFQKMKIFFPVFSII